jgi:hypothetical protein
VTSNMNSDGQPTVPMQSMLGQDISYYLIAATVPHMVQATVLYKHCVPRLVTGTVPETSGTNTTMKHTHSLHTRPRSLHCCLFLHSMSCNIYALMLLLECVTYEKKYSLFSKSLIFYACNC